MKTKEKDPEKLVLLYERFRDVCLVEKEVWTEIYMPRDIKQGMAVRTNIQDLYEVLIEDPAVESALDAEYPARETGPRRCDSRISRSDQLFKEDLIRSNWWLGRVQRP